MAVENPIVEAAAPHVDKLDGIGTMILAAGALGTAAFGIVEALKWTWLGTAGFQALLKTLGPLVDTLRVAYGKDYKKILKALYRGDQKELARVIRQGARVGLTDENAKEISKIVEAIDPQKLHNAVTQAMKAKKMDDDARNTLGQFELAVDARVDAALTLAKSNYGNALRVAASFVALGIALAVGANLGQEYIFKSLIVGITAVPLAPMAKDLVSAIQSASKAIKGK